MLYDQSFMWTFTNLKLTYLKDVFACFVLFYFLPRWWLVFLRREPDYICDRSTENNLTQGLV